MSSSRAFQWYSFCAWYSKICKFRFQGGVCVGNHCPKKDSEAFVYAYGGLKFLTLNGNISELLSESLGFLHLSVLHMKLLCDKEVIVGKKCALKK